MWVSLITPQLTAILIGWHDTVYVGVIALVAQLFATSLSGYAFYKVWPSTRLHTLSRWSLAALIVNAIYLLVLCAHLTMTVRAQVA